MTDAPELKPCPFCGGDAEIPYWGSGWPDSCYSVQCKDWKCPGKSSAESKQAAADSWNTRVNPATVSDDYVTVNIREGEIVGTPYGPDVPNGQYRWAGKLTSEREEQ